MGQFKKCLIAVTVICVALVSGCGGGGGGSAGTGTVTVGVTDAPINENEIAAVCIAFNRITIHHADGGAIAIPYNPSPPQVRLETHCMDMPVWDGVSPAPPVRLDALGGPVSVALAESIQVPEGRVTWIRLHLIPGASYIEDNTGERHNLICPSCEPTDNNQERGFKLNRTFEVSADEHIAIMVDVDLRKSLTKQDDSGTYVLRPTARMEPDADLGTITGKVDWSVIDGLGGAAYNGSDIDTGCAAYVYAGHDVAPDDFYEDSPVPVISTASVKYDIVMGDYRYAVGTLVGGKVSTPEPYTVALTCGTDDPELNDDLTFTAGQSAEVIAGQTWTAYF